MEVAESHKSLHEKIEEQKQEEVEIPQQFQKISSPLEIKEVVE